MTTPPPPPSTPAGWYPDPSGARGQRYWDGLRWTEHRTDQPTMAPPGALAPALPPAKKRKVWPWIVGVVLALFLIGAVSGHSSESGTSSTSASHTPTTAKVSASIAGVGQEARDGKFAFTVTGVETAKTTGDPSNPYEQATAQGEYVIVSMTVQNIGDRSQSFFAANQKLIDSAGRQYSADSRADMWINNEIQSDINPGNHVQAKVAFDVPAGTQPSTIELHDSMFSGGVKVRLS